MAHTLKITRPAEQSSVPPRAGPAAGAGSVRGAHPNNDEQFDLELAHRVREAMRGDTALAASQRTGISFQTVRRVMRTGKPTIGFLQRLCRVYEVDGHWLLTGEGSPRAQEHCVQPAQSIPTEAIVAELALRLGRALASIEVKPQHGRPASPRAGRRKQEPSAAYDTPGDAGVGAP